MTLAFMLLEFGWVSMIMSYLAAISQLAFDIKHGRRPRWLIPTALVLLPLVLLVSGMSGSDA